LKRERIFLVLAALFGLSLLSACGEVPVRRVTLPTEISAIADPFLSALKRGDTKGTEKHLAASTKDLPKIRFVEAQKMLAAAPDLKPVYFYSKPKALMGPKDNEYTVVYATRVKGKWKSVEMHLFALDGEPLKIEQWSTHDTAELPQAMQTDALMKNTLLYGGIFMVALIAVFIAGMIWFVRSRKMTAAADDRRVAIVVQG
jgi:hypothetical protein